MVAAEGDKPFRPLNTKRLASLFAAMGSSYNGVFQFERSGIAERAE